MAVIRAKYVLAGLILPGVPVAGIDRASAAAAAADDGAAIVVLASPLGAAGESLATAEDLARSRATSVADQIARTAPGVTIAEIQGNPLQPDIAYRGFTASPLLGTPQGLAVYLDGVRINQPFGDTVSWDLIAPDALADISLASGAAPQFGRNALGGALVLRTKDGASDPGVVLRAGAGSFARATLGAQAGGTLGGGFDWLVLADHVRERGWREASPSRATRGFARLGWHDGAARLALSGHYGATALTGNGLQELRLLARDRNSIYTSPDTTRNHAGLVALNGEMPIGAGVNLRANAFWRRIETTTLNGDVNDDVLGGDPYQPDADEIAALSAAGFGGFPPAGESRATAPFPRWRCIAQALLNTTPNETCTGLLNRSRTRQAEWGGTLEATLTARTGGLPHAITLGVALVRSTADFAQSSQFGYILPDRSVTPVTGPGAFADGTQASDDAYDARVDLHATTTALSAYALDSLNLTRTVRLDLAGRFDHTQVRNRDRITPGGGTGSLDSDPRYARLNPAVSLHWQVRAPLDLGVSWSQASRAPSAVELGCSDPASPCRLPNALAGDPPLRLVIARTGEVRLTWTGGAPGGPAWTARASVFRTDTADDILFVTDTPSGYGYFRNFGQTRRQGFEVAGSARRGRLSVEGSWVLLDATFQSAERVAGAANSASDAPEPGLAGTIAIRPGNRIPLIPRHTVKARLAWEATRALSLSLNVTAASSALARGNENNRHRPDGTYYLGPGRSAGYALVDAGAQLELRPGLRVVGTVRNLLGARYATAAQLGATAFDARGRFVARPFPGGEDGAAPLRASTFLAPGAPRSVDLGVTWRF